MCGKKIVCLISVLLFGLAATANAAFYQSGDVLVEATAATGAYFGGTEPWRAVNGSGLDVTGLLHDDESPTQFLSVEIWNPDGPGGGNPAGINTGNTWIAFEFDQVYSLAEMWVWNLNRPGETGRGMKVVRIHYSLDGSTYTEFGSEGDHEFAEAPGQDGYAHEDEIDFGGLDVKYLVISCVTDHGAGETHVGLAEVQFYVPEPATMALLGLGSVGLLLRKRRR